MRPSDADVVAIVDRSHQIVRDRPVERNCTTEAGQQDFVAIKIVEQVDLHTLHRGRERWVSQPTGIINSDPRFSC